MAGGQAGWLTTSMSRPVGAGAPGCGLVEEPERFHEPAAAGRVPEFCAFAERKNGARAGTHDDRVMAMAIGLGARAELLGRKTAEQ
jgi:hypothetical protein